MSELDAVKKAVQAMTSPRPQFFSDPAIDQVVDIAVALAGEVAVLQERIDTLERLIEKAGLASRAEIETYQPDPAVLKSRMARNEALVTRVFHTARAKLDGPVDGKTE